MSDNTNTSSGWGLTERRIWLGLFALLLAGIGTAQFMIIDALDKQTTEVSSIDYELEGIEDELMNIKGVLVGSSQEAVRINGGLDGIEYELQQIRFKVGRMSD